MARYPSHKPWTEGDSVGSENVAFTPGGDVLRMTTLNIPEEGSRENLESAAMKQRRPRHPSNVAVETIQPVIDLRCLIHVKH